MFGREVVGTHRVPGDKSITHRALMLAALSPGRSRIVGALTALDARSTASVLRSLGAEISQLRPQGEVEVRGKQQFAAPTTTLHCGNSGTTARLMLGLLAAHDFTARITGDASLRRRPMARVADPLRAMGAMIELRSPAGLPITITGGDLHGVSWTLPVASAQLKSAILLAGAVAGVPLIVSEPGQSRDHTERMLAYFGFGLERIGAALHFTPSGSLRPTDYEVPGDPSSAIFLLAAALLAGRGEIRVAGISLNPTRIGFIDVLSRMGAKLVSAQTDSTGPEPVGNVDARPTSLTACIVPADEVPGVIDEIPMLACLAARASGTSEFHQVGELRVKESDRLAMIAANLRRVGCAAEVDGDNLYVTGGANRLVGSVVTGGDHRIAMAFAVLGTIPGNEIVVDDPACVAVSFPDFQRSLNRIFTGASP